MRTRPALLGALVAVALVAPGAAFPHAEREIPSPPRPGSVPDRARAVAPDHVVNVCAPGVSDTACDYHSIQQAILDRIPLGKTTCDATPSDTSNWEIRLWPGYYPEADSRAQPELPPDITGNRGRAHSYQHHVDHPNSVNLIALVGRVNVTIRGVTRDAGRNVIDADAHQVVIDTGFTKHVGLRADCADGVILRNFAMWHAYDHGVYVLGTDGFVIDNVISSYSREYPFLTFADDHGLMRNCVAEGGGDGGLYPGGAPDTPERHSIEIDHCVTRHNVLGYSGTQGNSVWVHDSEFYDNAVGLVTDSETDHPNYPQNSLVLERNSVHDNNFNPYAAGSDVKATVFDRYILIPVGAGALLASGNDNVVKGNHVWGHDRYGVWLASGEGLLIGPTSDPPAPPFASSGNRFVDNLMFDPGGSGAPNAFDFAWDGFGLNNCWEGNVRTPGGQPATSEDPFLPPCSLYGYDMPVTAGVPSARNAYAQASLVFVDTDGDGANDTPICALTDTCGFAWNPNGPDHPENVPSWEGGSPRDRWARPAGCGPTTC